MDWFAIAGVALVVLGALLLVFRGPMRWFLEHTGGPDYRFRWRGGTEEEILQRYERTMTVMSVVTPVALVIFGFLLIVN